MIITIPVTFVEFCDDDVVVETENGMFLHVSHETTSVSKEPSFDVDGNTIYKHEAHTILGQIMVEVYEGEFTRIDDRLPEEFKRQLTAQIEAEAERLAKEAEEA